MNLELLSASWRHLDIVGWPGCSRLDQILETLATHNVDQSRLTHGPAFDRCVHTSYPTTWKRCAGFTFFSNQIPGKDAGSPVDHNVTLEGSMLSPLQLLLIQRWRLSSAIRPSLSPLKLLVVEVAFDPNTYKGGKELKNKLRAHSPTLRRWLAVTSSWSPFARLKVSWESEEVRLSRPLACPSLEK